MQADSDCLWLKTTLPALLLTTKQTCQLAGCGERTWWWRSRSGISPWPVLTRNGLGRAVRYRRDEILKWIDAGCPRCDG